MSTYDAAEEIRKGKAGALMVINNGCDIGAAFRHPSLGYISLLYGDRGHGIRHILYKRQIECSSDPRFADQVPQDVVLKLIEVVVLGHMKPLGLRRVFEYDGYRAILAAPGQGQLNYWLLTGFKIT